MDDATFRGDCGRCAGLCCVLLGFDRGAHFAFDKEAGTACRHLDSVKRCTVHDRLESIGMSGCAAYDCRGAGQIVTAIFAGFEAAGTEPVGRAIAAAFVRVRELQLLRLVLRRAPVSPSRDALERQLAPADGWTYAPLITLDLVAVRKSVQALALAAARDSRSDSRRQPRTLQSAAR